MTSYEIMVFLNGLAQVVRFGVMVLFKLRSGVWNRRIPIPKHIICHAWYRGNTTTSSWRWRATTCRWAGTGMIKKKGISSRRWAGTGMTKKERVRLWRFMPMIKYKHVLSFQSVLYRIAGQTWAVSERRIVPSSLWFSLILTGRLMWSEEGWWARSPWMWTPRQGWTSSWLPPL